MLISDFVRKQLIEGQEIFRRALEPSGHACHELDLDCTLLPRPGYLSEGNNLPIEGYSALRGTLPIELSKAGLEESFFKQLPKDDKPCLYRFAIKDGQNTRDIWKAYLEFQEIQSQINKDKRRASAAVKLEKNIDFSTSTLYVGKVKSNVGGRMAVHAGYYHVGTTAGLQLWYWAKELQLELLVHVIEFEEKMKPFVSSLELEYSREHRPLFGMQ